MIRSRKYQGVVYPDCEYHKSFIERLKNKSINSCAIIHDRDKFTGGELNGQIKKIHIHFIINFKNARYIDSVAQEYGLKPQELEPVHNYKGALRYLIHFDDPDKEQYLDSEVFGPLEKDFLNAISDNETEEEKILFIMSYIEGCNYELSITELVKWCCNNGVYDICRRSATFIRDICNEHNYDIRNRDYNEKYKDRK